MRLDGIGHALADAAMCVPKYQRSYAWEDKHVTELLTDLSEAIAAKSTEYFLGSIVIAGDEVVDGQQRLATVSMLLAAIRDHFDARGDHEGADDIQNMFLATRDRRTKKIKAKLQLNAKDHDYYFQRVLSRDPSLRSKALPRRDPHRRISRAADLCAALVSQVASKPGDAEQHLLDWVDFLETQAKVVLVTVPDEANAFTIFEVLNDRGLELALTDLLKNYLFNRAGDRIDEVQSSWLSMYGQFETSDTELLVIDYVRQLWSSRHGLTRERQLYVAIRRVVKTQKQAVDFAVELEASGRTYQAIVNPDHALWQGYGPSAREYMRALNTLGITRVRPLILGVLDVFEPNEARKALKLMLSWAVRFMIVGGLGTGTLEEYYSERAKEIRSGSIENAAALRKAMAKLVPMDAVFEEAFARASISKSVVARYLLRALERERMNQPEPELVPNENEEQVNLEHVMPKAAAGDWLNVPEHVRDVYTSRIGNLALMQRKPNSQDGNANFAAKAKTYRASAYATTRMIAAARQWGAKEIDRRQQALAKLAVKAWSLKVT